MKRCLFLVGILLMLSVAKASPVDSGSKLASPPSDIPPGLGLSSDGRAKETGKEQINDIDASVERMIWDKTPLPITLTVGQERLISFPGNVRIGIPNALSPLLRSQSQNGTVYWLASQPFEATRVQVQDSQSGQFYLVDLQATEQPVAASRVEIINAAAVSTPNKPATTSGSQFNGSDTTAITTKASPQSQKKLIESSDYILLTRYAAQQLYAPTRLIKTRPDIHTVPMRAKAGEQLIRGGQITDEPVAAWRKGALVVTAVKLINRSAQRIELDPRLIRGAWLAATFQQGQLGPSYSDTSMTAVYLITDVAMPESE